MKKLVVLLALVFFPFTADAALGDAPTPQAMNVATGEYTPSPEDPVLYPEFYQLGENTVGDTLVVITNAKDKRIGRVKLLRTSLEDNSPEAIASKFFYYNGCTEVCGAFNDKIVYYYNDKLQITAAAHHHDNEVIDYRFKYDTNGHITHFDAIDDEHRYEMRYDQSPPSTFSTWMEKIDNFLSVEQQIAKHGDDIAMEVFGAGILNFSGYFIHPQEVGTYGNGELSDKFRITFINGILNVLDDHLQTMELLSESHGNNNIHYIFNPTRGWTWDILKSTLIRLGYVSEQAGMLAAIWRKLIKEMGGVNSGGIILHYSHSIGTGETYAASSMLTPEEQKMIRVVTIGSPIMIPQNGFNKVENYASMRDGVCLFDPLRYLGLISDPDINIIYVDTLYGIPLIDHTIASGAYKLLIEEKGRQFLEMINSDQENGDIRNDFSHRKADREITLGG